jgi:hypothetical protein
MLALDVPYINPAVFTFWLLPWSQPYRSACRWFTPDTQPASGRPRPDKEAPSWLRPLFLQRWVGQAIAARLQAHPNTSAYRYGKESRPCWESVAWLRYPWRILHQFDDEMLLSLFGMEVERLLRIAQEHPSFAGQVEWTCAVLGASEHLAQVYHELKRRHTWQAARAMLRQELRQFTEWQATDTPDQENDD